MRYSTVLLAAMMLLSLGAATVDAQVNTIPGNTVIPVVLDENLSSAYNNIGDRFTSHCAGNCAGFPNNTSFEGVITSITRGSGRTPAQLDVSFTQAVMPDGTIVPISGMLTSLDPNAVSVDPRTGFMTSRPGTGAERNRFIAYGAGAGLVIGAITGDTLKGGLIGAVAGWLYGASLGRGTVPRDVEVPAGTRFGVLLTQDVALGRPGPGPRTGPGRGPCPIRIVFAGDIAPITTGRGVVLVPARATMQALDIPFRISTATDTLTVNTRRVTATHRLNTATAIVNGRTIRLSAPSRTEGTVLYVPTDLLEALTGNNIRWQSRTNMLIVE